MKCRYCNTMFNEPRLVDYGDLPMTPNALEKDELLNESGHYHTYDYSVTSCNKCGLIQQVGNPDMYVLYHKFKNQQMGPTWGQHYISYADFITNHASNDGLFLEVGCGDYTLAQELLQRGVPKVVTVDRITGSRKPPSEKIDHKNGFLEEVELNDIYDVVYSSHVFEHIEEIHQHFECVVKNIVVGSKYFISLPDFKPWIENNYLNAFNQEHVTYALLSDIEYITGMYGFKLIDKEEWRGHSLFVALEYVGVDKLGDVSVVQQEVKYKTEILKNYSNVHNKLKSYLKNQTSGKKVYLFGGNSSSQILLSFALKGVKVECILDNASIKHDKYLYGHDIMVRDPSFLADINDVEDSILIVFVGAFSAEIKDQVNKINPKLKVITEKNFYSV